MCFCAWRIDDILSSLFNTSCDTHILKEKHFHSKLLALLSLAAICSTVSLSFFSLLLLLLLRIDESQVKRRICPLHIDFDDWFECIYSTGESQCEMPVRVCVCFDQSIIPDVRMSCRFSFSMFSSHFNIESLSLGIGMKFCFSTIHLS